MDKDQLSREVELYLKLGNALTPQEQAALQRVYSVLQARSLFDTGETAKAIETAAATGARAAFALTGHETAWRTLSNSPKTPMFFSPDGARLFVCNEGIHVLQRDSGEPLDVWLPEDNLDGPPVISADWKTLYAGVRTKKNYEARLVAIDAQTGEERWRFAAPNPGEYASRPALSPDGGTIFFCESGKDQLIAIDAHTCEERWRAKRSCHWGELLVSRDGKQLYSATKDALQSYDTATGEVQWKLPFSSDGHNTGALSPDGKTLYWHRADGVSAIDTATGEVRLELGEKHPIKKWDFISPSPDGKWVVTSNSDDGHVQVLDAATGDEMMRIQVGSRYAFTRPPCFTADGGTMVLINAEARAKLFVIKLGEWSQREVFPEDNHATGSCGPSAPAITPDGSWAYFHDLDCSKPSLRAIDLRDRGA
jgi:outer membrane protein assembly factor BamB